MNKYIFPALAVTAAIVVGPSAVSANHSAHESEATQAVTTTESHASVSATVSSAPATCEFTENLGLGAKGAGVTCLQQELIEAGHLTAIDAPTGNFGALTAEALKKWQAAHDIAATGYFGPLTRAALHESVHEAMGVSDDHHDAAETETAHAHSALDVSGWAKKPSVTATLHEDAMGGYNLEVTPANFRFAPEHVNGAVVEGEGHAHVYINGVKYTRLYGSWMYLPAAAFKKGENVVRVTLNANDHSDLAIGSTLVEASTHVTVK